MAIIVLLTGHHFNSHFNIIRGNRRRKKEISPTPQLKDPVGGAVFGGVLPGSSSSCSQSSQGRYRLHSYLSFSLHTIHLISFVPFSFLFSFLLSYPLGTSAAFICSPLSQPRDGIFPQSCLVCTFR